MLFNVKEMGNYPYRAQMKADMGIAALGFQNAAPVHPDLVGKTAKCVKYDCRKEQATILEFRLLTEQ